MENIFDDYRGILLFLIVMVILSLLFTIRINNLNDIANIKEPKTEEIKYA